MTERTEFMIGRMCAADVRAVAELERECFSDPWSTGLLEESMDNGLDICLVCREGEKLAGYLIFRILAGEGELFRIAVREDLRGLGYGKKLMDAMVDYSRDCGISVLSLEVRESNKAARSLYKTFGFKEEAVRRGYYRDPQEDAVIMWKRGV